MKHALVASVARIVVIEDNASDVFLLERALNQHDLRFELVHLLSGREALAFIRRQGAYAKAPIPNLILVDLNLSKYTGEDMRKGHAHLVAKGLNDSHFDAVMDNLGATLTELKVPGELIAQAAAIAESTRKDVLGK